MPLAGSLRKIEFGKFLEGQDFENFLLKNKASKIWNDNRPHTLSHIGKPQSDKLLIIFMNILDDYLSRDAYTAEQKTSLTKMINLVFLRFFEFYLKKENLKKDYDELIKELEDLNKRGLIYDETITKIKESIKNKEYKPILEEMTIQKNNLATHFDYAIITALEEDEMEKVLPMFVKEGEFENSHNYIEYGHLKDKPTKKIVYASQHKTGMVDASILATELLVRFNPKFLIMVGVLGGKPESTNIGDVIIANKVFELDRGKLTDLGFKKEISSSNINSRELLKINRNKNSIEQFINDSDSTRKKNIQMHLGAIACVNHVIDLEGFFGEKISEIDRKAIALEMESFAIVRACELINNGHTKPLITRSALLN